ncbi:MAG: sigma-70 family RNA polymerase sigma factor [Chitinophagales bacterium]
MRQLKIHTQITKRDSLSLEKYLQDISKIELLTADQEVQLAKRIKTGDEEALDELTKANLRFVVSVAKQYQNQGLTLSDLINEGNVGLIKAAKRFDETKGFKFISYAVWWIRQAIMQALVEQSRIVRLPLNKIDAYQKLTKELAIFLQTNQRKPSTAELAQLVGMSVKDVQQLLKINGKHLSIDAPLDEETDSLSLIDKLFMDDGQGPDNKLMSESLRNEVKEALSVLPKREAQIIESYFGLNNSGAMSLEDIALRFDLTRERVRQIKERAIRRLRKTSRSGSLKTYLG